MCTITGLMSTLERPVLVNYVVSIIICQHQLYLHVNQYLVVA